MYLIFKWELVGVWINGIEKYLWTCCFQFMWFKCNSKRDDEKEENQLDKG